MISPPPGLRKRHEKMSFWRPLRLSIVMLFPGFHVLTMLPADLLPDDAEPMSRACLPSGSHLPGGKVIVSFNVITFHEYRGSSVPPQLSRCDQWSMLLDFADHDAAFF